MNQYTTEEIIEKAQSIFDAEHAENYCMGWEEYGCIEIEANEPELVKITINCMYAAPSPTLKVMTALAEFFDTKNINDDDHFAEGGCETCDYGSSYGYTLSVRPEKPCKS